MAKVVAGYSKSVDQVVKQLQPGMGEWMGRTQTWASTLVGDALSRGRAPVSTAPYQMTLGLPWSWQAEHAAEMSYVNASPAPYSPQFFLPDTYEFGLPYTKVPTPAPGKMPQKITLLDLLKQGNDPNNYLFMTPLDGSVGKTGSSMIVKNQFYGGKHGWDFSNTIEGFLAPLQKIFGTPAGAGNTTPIITRPIPHGGSLEFATPIEGAMKAAEDAANAAIWAAINAGGNLSSDAFQKALAPYERAKRILENLQEEAAGGVKKVTAAGNAVQPSLGGMPLGPVEGGRTQYYVPPDDVVAGPMSTDKAQPIKWPGDQKPGAAAFKPGTGIASARGRKGGSTPEAHAANLMGARDPLTEGDEIREAENTDKFDVFGSDEELSTDPNRPGYMGAADTLETLKLENSRTWELEFKSEPDTENASWLASENHTLAGMETPPQQPVLPYTEMPRHLSQYDGPDGYRQWFVDRIQMFYDSLQGPNPPSKEIIAKVEQAIADTKIVKVARHARQVPRKHEDGGLGDWRGYW